MVRRLTLDWPDPGPFAGRQGRPIRWLAVSDDPDPVLLHAGNHAGLEPLDALVGCGDLEPEYLAYLADAFRVPLAYVRGNHDRGGRWDESVRDAAPRPLDTGRLHRLGELPIAALEWPGLRHRDRQRHDGTAWLDALRLAGRREVTRLLRGSGPVIVVSHAPPRGVGDRAADPYHVGYEGYRWLLDRWQPPLWLHGHVPPASVEHWRVAHEGTDVVNVTGAVLIEIRPPGTVAAGPGRAPRGLTLQARGGPGRLGRTSAPCLRTAARGPLATSGRGTGTGRRPGAARRVAPSPRPLEGAGGRAARP